MSKNVVQLRDVTKSFGNLQALKSISLTIEPGEVLGLFGHNGAGKSTLMKLILGIIEPSSGEVLTLEHSPTANGSHHYRQQFGYLPENVSFYDQLSGFEVLLYFARLKGFDRHEASRLLAEVGLEAAAKRAVKTYSKGMRQRLGLAQALLGNPRLLLLDEPTVGLDPVATSDFYSTVDRLKSGGCAVVLCSHVLPGVESHIDRAMILSEGKALALGTLEQLRMRTSLPIHIKATGLSLKHQPLDIKSSLECYLPPKSANHEDARGRITLTVPKPQKMSVLRLLTSIPEIEDIELVQPSLETLYRHYIANDGTENPALKAVENPPKSSVSTEDKYHKEVDHA